MIIDVKRQNVRETIDQLSLQLRALGARRRAFERADEGLRRVFERAGPEDYSKANVRGGHREVSLSATDAGDLSRNAPPPKVEGHQVADGGIVVAAYNILHRHLRFGAGSRLP